MTNVQKNKQHLLSMTNVDFNAKVLCEGMEAVQVAAKILGIEVDQENRWVATEQLYKGFKKLKAELQ